MKKSYKSGLGFGLASGTITTLGLLVGIYYSTGSRLAVIGGILTIAIVDAMSDAFGIHISKESEKVYSQKQTWEATFSTFFFKFIFALSFILPVFLFSLKTAVMVGLGWGLLLITGASVWIAKIQKRKIWSCFLEHMSLAIVVIFVTQLVGKWIAATFS